jgi:hypothetical protein
LDIGLVSSKLGYDMSFIFAQDAFAKANGGLAEQFVGQELLANEPPNKTKELFYWHREAQGSSAELDYLKAVRTQVIPIEVKFGSTGQLRSLRMFMDLYQPKIAVRFSQNPLSLHEKLLSVPFYLVSEFERLVQASLSQANT